MSNEQTDEQTQGRMVVELLEDCTHAAGHIVRARPINFMLPPLECVVIGFDGASAGEKIHLSPVDVLLRIGSNDYPVAWLKTDTPDDPLQTKGLRSPEGEEHRRSEEKYLTGVQREVLSFLRAKDGLKIQQLRALTDGELSDEDLSLLEGRALIEQIENPDGEKRYFLTRD